MKNPHSSTSQAPWLDVKTIKSQVRIAQILDSYYWLDEMAGKGEQLYGPSPFNKGEQLSVNTRREIWNDTGGRPNKVAGDVPGLVQAFENCNFQRALQIINKKFIENSTDSIDKNRGRISQNLREEQSSMSENEAFGKKLSGLRTKDVPWLREMGIDERDAKELGIGYCSRGLMKGRIVFPICRANKNRTVVAYAGQSLKTDDPMPIKFPSGFKPGLELFGVEHLVHEGQTKQTAERFGIIVVKWFVDYLALYRENIRNVVAIMGDEISPAQYKILTRSNINPTKRVTLVVDENQNLSPVVVFQPFS